jgi:lysophospholipase L1-like esterase
MNKSFKFLLTVLSIGALLGCSKKESSSPTDNTDKEVDYGEVYFSDVTLYNYFDSVQLAPVFTNPEACKDEHFEYTISNEDAVYLDDGDILYRQDNCRLNEVKAKSEHFEKTFFVNSIENMENADFLSKGRRNMFDESKMRKGSTLFLGDSFFEFWKAKIGIQRSFNDEFGEYNVYNIGISATQTKHWRAYAEKVITDYEPKNIVINIGINDIDDANLIGKMAGINVVSFINDLHIRLPETKIYWFTLTRCSGGFATKWPQYIVANDFVKEYSEKVSYLEVLDVMSLYGDDYASYEQDGLHPNQAGYDLFKQLIEENVELEKI